MLRINVETKTGNQKTAGSRLLEYSEVLFPNGVLLAQKILFEIDPECKHQVNDDRRSKCNKSGVNKIEPDDSGRNSKPVADGAANAEHTAFHEVFKSKHQPKLMRFVKISNHFQTGFKMNETVEMKQVYLAERILWPTAQSRQRKWLQYSFFNCRSACESAAFK